jgi:hypothetical protein
MSLHRSRVSAEASSDDGCIASSIFTTGDGDGDGDGDASFSGGDCAERWQTHACEFTRIDERFGC